MTKETEARWVERVAAWRASGQTSTEFSQGRGFSASGLRYWAHRLSKAEKPRRAAPAIRLARVERAPSPVAAEGSAPAASESEAGAVLVHMGGLQVAVRRGFDRDTLAAVLDVLDRRGHR